MFSVRQLCDMYSRRGLPHPDQLQTFQIMDSGYKLSGIELLEMRAFLLWWYECYVPYYEDSNFPIVRIIQTIDHFIDHHAEFIQSRPQEEQDVWKKIHELLHVDDNTIHTFVDLKTIDQLIHQALNCILVTPDERTNQVGSYKGTAEDAPKLLTIIEHPSVVPSSSNSVRHEQLSLTVANAVETISATLTDNAVDSNQVD
jgi:hypothetical protein